MQPIVHCTCLCFLIFSLDFSILYCSYLKKNLLITILEATKYFFSTLCYFWCGGLSKTPFVLFFLTSPFSSNFSFICSIISNGRKVNSFVTGFLHYPKIEPSQINFQKSKWHRVRKQSLIFLKQKSCSDLFLSENRC